jgi:hypothetical protein
MIWREFTRRAAAAFGLGTIPDEANSTTPYCQDWVDTAESQRLLQFQRHVLDDYLEDMKAALGLKRHLIRVFRPMVRWYFLRQSPYYRAAK